MSVGDNDVRCRELEPAGTVHRRAAQRSLGQPRGRLGSAAARSRSVPWLIWLFWLVPHARPRRWRACAAPPTTARPAGGPCFREPSQLTLDNYRRCCGNERILDSLWNTVLITVPSTILVVVLGALGAYALAWIDFPGRDWLFVLVVALIVVPVQVAIIPDAKLFGALGIYGSIPAVIAFHVAFGLPFAIFLLRNFFVGIPRDLLEAARMDGATEFTDLPPGRAADRLAGDRLAGHLPVPVGLERPARRAGLRHVGQRAHHLRPARADAGLLIQHRRDRPGAFLSMLVPLVVFFAFQRYFVQGVLAGSVK